MLFNSPDFSKPQPVPAQASASYPAFWRQFKAAVAAKNVGAVKALTQFPFSLGFEDDETHPKRLDAAQFQTYFKAEMTCRGPDAPRTDDILKETKPQVTPNGVVHISTYTFEYKRAGWRFTTADYGDSDEVAPLLRGRCPR